MEPTGAMAEIKAEAPMAEMLGYAPDLRSITGGQGDYTLEFLRYEEVPGSSRKRSSRARCQSTPRRTPERQDDAQGGAGGRVPVPGARGHAHDRHIPA